MERKKWAVITGAGSGIGEEFAVQLWDMGYSVILIGRTEEKLTAVRKKLIKRERVYERRNGSRRDPSSEIVIMAKDLSDLTSTEAVIRDIGAIMHDDNVPAVLVNSAGYGVVGEFTDIGIDVQETMVDVNVKALMLITYRMIGMMEKAGGGRILNVASSAGLFPGGPYMSVYYATKSFVVSFTNGVRRELMERKSPVRISALCPGPVNTPFNNRAGVRNALHGISPARCVKAAIKGMKRDTAVIIPEISIRFAALGARILPDRVMIPIVAHQQKKKM